MEDKTVETQELSWEDYVRKEVNTLLDTFLPNADSGTVGIRYKRPVLEELEEGPVYAEDKAEAVSINLVFNFKGVVDVPKEEG